MVTNVLEFSKQSINPRSATTDSPTGEELLLTMALQLGEIQNQVNYASEQNNYIKELLERNRVKPLTSSTSFTYPFSFGPIIPDTQYTFNTKCTSDQMDAYKRTTGSVDTAMVPLHKVLEFGSVLLCFICLAGISSWLINDAPLINPFAATLGLLASPFFYVMGRVARK